MPRQMLQFLIIALISFLTLVDLFATQAILPSLARAYGVAPAAIASAVNACTFGMAAAGVVVAWFSARINRRAGVGLSLALLAIPTALLAFMPSLGVFAALRIVQGLFMSAAFSLTIAYLAESFTAEDAATALAAYVTGNVASNLFGRLLSAAVADHFGIAQNFVIFAALNLLGAALAFAALRRGAVSSAPAAAQTRWRLLLHRPELLAGFGIGFIILFTFIGTFTYVNFVLTGPVGLSPMQLGFVYFVFLPSIIATPFAGQVAKRFGARAVIAAGLAVAVSGLPFFLAVNLPSILIGLTLMAAGTFFAQATATGYISRNSGPLRGAAGGLYLASYYAGGLAGTLILGQVFDRIGWNAAVLVIGAALIAAIVLARQLSEQPGFIQSRALSKQ